MPVTEFARLALIPPYTLHPPSPGLLRTLHQTIIALQTFTRQRFAVYRARASPPADAVYLVGGWDSLSHHIVGYHATAEYAAVFAALKDMLEIDWMRHVNISVDRFPLDAPVVVVERWLLSPGDRRDMARVVTERAARHWHRTGGCWSAYGGVALDELEAAGREWLLCGAGEGLDTLDGASVAEGEGELRAESHEMVRLDLSGDK